MCYIMEFHHMTHYSGVYVAQFRELLPNTAGIKRWPMKGHDKHNITTALCESGIINYLGLRPVPLTT
jgi:hypothetical protein